MILHFGLLCYNCAVLKITNSTVWKVSPKKFADLKMQLCFNRGLKTDKQVNEFFNPKLDYYQKDLDISGIKLASKRITKAIKSQELIIVYGDYDVDGICACAILYKALSTLGAKILPYIPHREKEGYGLSRTGLEFARDSGAGLVITVDNGIVAFEQADFAKSLGLDLIITDHHTPMKKKPTALAIVHTTKICGAAVAWCLVEDLISKTLSQELLELVAIATIADMMPLIGVNRALVFEGLKQLNKTKNIGLLALIRESGIDLGSIGSYEVGYILAPRINAIGRLEHAIDALRLVCTKDPTKARKLAKLLSDSNIQRQLLTTQAVEEARVLAVFSQSTKIFIVESRDWVPGIIGLVAARICEENLKPAIALSVGETHSKGSARSVDGINIVELIRGCSDILVDVGGHSGAAGFTILNEHIPVFKERLGEAMADSADNVFQTLEIEAEVSARDLSEKLVREIETLEPFGFGNKKPLLVTREMLLTDLRTLSEGKHLKGKAEGIDFIAFGMGELLKDLALDSYYRVRRGNYRKTKTLKADLAYFLEINKFNGIETLQLKVKDIKLR